MIEFRQYTNEDYDAVCDFLIEINRDRSHINWNWARFEWMEGHPDFDSSLISSIGLWRNDGKIAGAAIYDMYLGEAFCAARKGFEDLYPEILTYAYQNLKDENGLAIAIRDDNLFEIQATEKAGFKRQEYSETVMRISLNTLREPRLCEGLIMGFIDPSVQTEEYQWLLWQGFDHGTDKNEFAQSDIYRGHMRRHFSKDLSAAVYDQNGNPVSCACAWFRPDTDYAYLEPVCTVPSYRGKGIAKAAVIKALIQAAQSGAETAYVISDSAFYRKAGFVIDSRYTFYRKR